MTDHSKKNSKRKAKPAATATAKPRTGSAAFSESSDNGTSILTEALRLSELGLPITPVDGKRPTLSEWQKRRLTPEELKLYLKSGKRNFGLVINLSNVIDVEGDEGEQSETEFREMCEGEIPVTPTYTSKRSTHRLFKRPEGLPQKAAVKIGAVEFRLGNDGRGAMSVLPPSVHPDGPKYRWVEGQSIFEVPIADLPSAVVERLRNGESPKKAEASGSDSGEIHEGERNKTLFKMACQMFRAKLSANDVLIAVMGINLVRCKPELEETEVRAIVDSAALQGQTRAHSAMELVARFCELWHTPDNVAFATIKRHGHKEHWRLRSSGFKNWLGKAYYEEEQGVIGTQTLQDILNTLEGQALFDGAEHPVYLRVAGDDDRIFIDLCNDQWQAVEIDKDGWRVVNDPPVRFCRTAGMRPLPLPVRGGGKVAHLLWPFVNLTPQGFVLFLSWVVAALRPATVYPILKLIGEQGNTKTTLAAIARSLIDPHTAALRRRPNDTADIWIAAKNGWVIAYDNLSFINTDFSDTLCVVSTGGSDTKRRLYSDDEEHAITAVRPVLLTGIEDIGNRSDFLDRCVNVELPPIDPAQRKEPELFWREFHEAHPRILGSLFDALSATIRNLPIVRKSYNPKFRLKGFTIWARAAEKALGFSKVSFHGAFTESQRRANEFALASCPITTPLQKLLKQLRGRYAGTATDLLEQLSLYCSDTRAKQWPKAANALSGILHRFAPNFRTEGWTLYERNVPKPDNPKTKPVVWFIALPGHDGHDGHDLFKDFTIRWGE